MGARKPKFYVVWKGARPGVYTTWPEANAQVAGFPGAQYRSFASRAEAERALARGPGPSRSDGGSRRGAPQRGSAPARSTPSSPPANAVIVKPSLSVDAACSGNPGKMEYQGVDTATGERYFHQAFPVGTNNIGEFLALVHGLAWCKAQGLPRLTIYTDSRIAMGWIANKRCKTTLPRAANTAKLYELIDRGEAWLQAHPVTNPIVKWETKRWGEIPADFGRK